MKYTYSYLKMCLRKNTLVPALLVLTMIESDTVFQKAGDSVWCESSAQFLFGKPCYLRKHFLLI